MKKTANKVIAKIANVNKKDVKCNCFIFCTFKSDHFEFLYTLPKLETVNWNLAARSKNILSRKANE